jgi:hypothetical protein
MEAGELAVARLGGDRSLILKYNNECAGVLEGAGNHKGRWFPGDNGIRCISLGTDWFLDVTLDQNFFPENPQVHEANTMLFYGPAGFQWKFLPHNNIHDEIYVPLVGGEPSYFLEQHSAPVLQWSIWESENHRLAPGNQPLLRSPI